MIVTDIKQQIKNTNRYSVFIDHKYFHSFSESEIIELNLVVGQVLVKGAIDKLNGEAQFSTAKNSCLRLLSYRARSSGEITDYLIRKKYSPETIDKTLEYLTSKDLLNDEQFVKFWIENRLNIKHSSIKQIKNELYLKKVNKTLVNKVIDNMAIDDFQQIKLVVEKKRNQPKYQNDLRLMQYLSRKGFSYDKILIALGRRAE